MKLIRLTHSVTEKGIYVDFDKVVDPIIERKENTLIWQDNHAITVKESPEQINKLVKKAKSKAI